MKIKYIIFLFLTVMLTGCFTDFEPDLESKPVVCINANAKVGEELIIHVTHTWRWSAQDRFDNMDIKDAEVTLYVNDIEYDKPDYSEWDLEPPFHPWKPTDSGYKTGYIPTSGDKIRIVVHSKDYGDAEGEVTVPYPVNIDDVKISSKIEVQEDEYFDPYYNGYITKYKGNSSLEIFFTDPADVTNYYLVDCGLTGGYDSTMWEDFRQETHAYIDFSVEPLFTEHVSSLESAVSETYGYTVFSDRMISGKTYPVHIKVENISYPVLQKGDFESNKSYISFTLNSISDSYYRHVISVWESNDGINGVLGDVGLADHVWECSNVSSGAGVISAVAPSTIQIPLSSIVTEQSINNQ